MIDVCLVTKRGVDTISGIEHIPVKNLIIETSKPLGMARKRAIDKVKTEWFAFIDDDIKIDKDWFNTVWDYTRQNDVGAIQGLINVVGVGYKMDEDLRKVDHKLMELKIGERGFTHNTLIRTELVKDWTPPLNISAWEDYSLTQHILNKGFKWIKVQTKAEHEKTWDKIKKNITWGVQGRKFFFPSNWDSLLKIIKCFIWIIRVGLNIKINWRKKLYIIYCNSCVIQTHIIYLIHKVKDGEES